MNRDLACLARRYFLSRVVDDGDSMAGIRPAHAAGTSGPLLVRVADDVIHFGLAEHFIDCHAKRIATPVEHCLPDSLPGAHQGAQLQPIRCARFGHRLHHHLQRGRKQECVGHAVPLHQLERTLGTKAAAIADDRKSEIHRRQQRVHQTSGPSPIRRRPEHVAWLRKPVMRGDEARQVADQRAMRHQRALRRPGRPTRVDQQRRIIRERNAPASKQSRWRRQQRTPSVPTAFVLGFADDDQMRAVRGSVACTCSIASRAVASTMATTASLSCSRYSRASGPNNKDSGIATAPI